MHAANTNSAFLPLGSDPISRNSACLSASPVVYDQGMWANQVCENGPGLQRDASRPSASQPWTSARWFSAPSVAGLHLRCQKSSHHASSTILRSQDTLEHTSWAATRAICVAPGRIPTPQPQACALGRFDDLDRRCLVPLEDILGSVGSSSVRCRRSHRISASVRPFPP